MRTIRAGTAKLVIVCGRSFAGKTTLARHLARRFGYAEVDVDDTKARLFGRAIDERELASTDWTRIYQGADEEISGWLAQGRSVVDASRNFTKRERDHARQLASAHGAEVVTIHVEAPAAVTRARLMANRRTNERRDISDDAFEALLSGWEPPGSDEQPLVFPVDADPEIWMMKHTNVLSET